jgi:hypothetical protein
MFDVKLIDGRYFKNVSMWDCDLGEFDNIEHILNRKEDIQIYSDNDDTGETLLAEVNCDEIEYVCKAYTYREGEE